MSPNRLPILIWIAFPYPPRSRHAHQFIEFLEPSSQLSGAKDGRSTSAENLRNPGVSDTTHSHQDHPIGFNVQLSGVGTSSYRIGKKAFQNPVTGFLTFGRA